MKSRNFLKPTRWKLLLAAFLLIPGYYVIGYLYTYLDAYCVPITSEPLLVPGQPVSPSPPTFQPCGFITYVVEAYETPHSSFPLLLILAFNLLLVYFFSCNVTALYRKLKTNEEK